MMERPQESRLLKPEEYAFDLEYANDYLAVRVDVVDGEKFGALIGHDEDLGVVAALLEADRATHPTSLYHCFMPLDFINKSEGWLVGGEDIDG